jgi:hypothetical protein
MPLLPQGNIEPRAVLEAYFETGNTPTETDFWDVIASYVHKTEDAYGYQLHNNAIAYPAGWIVLDPVSKQPYLAIADVPIGTPLSNTFFWEALSTDGSYVIVPDLSTMVELKALGASSGPTVRVLFSGTSPNTFAIYFFVATAQTENLPYVVDANGGGSWIALAGRYAQQPLTLNNSLTVLAGTTTNGIANTGTIANTGNLTNTGTLTNNGAATFGNNVTLTAGDTIFTAGKSVGGGLALGRNFVPNDNNASSSPINLSLNQSIQDIRKVYLTTNLPVGINGNVQLLMRGENYNLSGTDTFEDGTTEYVGTWPNETLAVYEQGYTNPITNLPVAPIWRRFALVRWRDWWDKIFGNYPNQTVYVDGTSVALARRDEVVVIAGATITTVTCDLPTARGFGLGNNAARAKQVTLLNRRNVSINLSFAQGIGGPYTETLPTSKGGVYQCVDGGAGAFWYKIADFDAPAP